jgi:predicted cupin superfamily sugar epimerase
MIDELIRQFNLKPLPVEGGLFTQSYRSDIVLTADMLPARYAATVARPAGVAIMYLLTPDADSFSALHRLPTDEIYHFYLGDPIELLQLYPDGRSERVVMGQDVLNGQRVQYVVPRDVWQGAYLLSGGKFALVGTTMAPGYIHSDYEGGDRDALIAQYPHEAELITRLTRPNAPLITPPGSEA